MTRLLAVFAVLAVSACTPLSINIARPRPNIALGAQGHALKLELGPDVPDAWTIPEQQGIRSLDVLGWHSTLDNGFQSGFSGAFSGKETWALKLERAELVLMPTIISGSNVSTVHAQLTYRARLVDVSGKEISVAAGTVESKTTASRATQDEMTRLAGDAVEVMYEHLSTQVFATN